MRDHRLPPSSSLPSTRRAHARRSAWLAVTGMKPVLLAEGDRSGPHGRGRRAPNSARPRCSAIDPALPGTRCRGYRTSVSDAGTREFGASAGPAASTRVNSTGHRQVKAVSKCLAALLLTRPGELQVQRPRRRPRARRCRLTWPGRRAGDHRRPAENEHAQGGRPPGRWHRSGSEHSLPEETCLRRMGCRAPARPAK
jgi:hypothetical protein